MKRKRTSSAIDTNDGGTRRNADQPPLECSTGGRESPRTAVSSKLGNLHLDNADLAPPTENRKSLTTAKALLEDEASAESQQAKAGPDRVRLATSILLNEIGDVQMTLLSPHPQFDETHPKSLTVSDTAERPATPLLGPVGSCQGKSLAVVSPLSVDMKESYVGAQSEQPQSIHLIEHKSGVSGLLASVTQNAASSSKVNTFLDLPSGVRSTTCHRITKATKRRRSSPTLTSTLNDLVWSEQEITGCNPNDPNDDGYGINGIGFKPTPAIAQQRKMQRQRQIVEWRKREGNERRARRRESRRENLAGANSTPCLTEDFPHEGNKKVRFVDTDEPTT